MKLSTQSLRMTLAPVLAALVLAGCASVPAIDASTLPATPAAFKEAQGRWTTAAPSETQARGEWWLSFSDPILNGLVGKASGSNTSIQIAAGRLAQARALVRSTDADRWPQLGIGAGATRE